MPPNGKEESYLGDGVYAWFDGYQIWIKTERENGWCEIALEPKVFDKLNEYKQRITNSLKKDNA